MVIFYIKYKNYKLQWNIWYLQISPLVDEFVAVECWSLLL